MFFIVFIVVLLFIVIILFSFPQFSPVPYFPTNKKDLPLIIKALCLKNNQTIIDLGAGDGIVIFESAQKAFEKKLNTMFVAIEINIILILILHLRRFFHPNKKNIQIVYGDIFKLNSDQLTTSHQSLVTIYIYISPWLIDKLIKSLKLKTKNFSLVSYFYEIKTHKPKQVLSGRHKIFIY